MLDAFAAADKSIQGLAEKRGKCQFGLTIWFLQKGMLKFGMQAGHHVRNIVSCLFCDLKV